MYTSTLTRFPIISYTICYASLAISIERKRELLPTLNYSLLYLTVECIYIQVLDIYAQSCTIIDAIAVKMSRLQFLLRFLIRNNTNIFIQITKRVAFYYSYWRCASHE